MDISDKLFIAFAIIVLALAARMYYTTNEDAKTDLKKVGNNFQRYLRTLYPTSPRIAQMGKKEAQKFYENYCNVWYRIPSEQIKNGLFSKRVKPSYGIFFFPDSMANSARSGRTIGLKGFYSQSGRDASPDNGGYGSSNRYLEVTSFGWVTYPYGAYLNWAPGSGIFLDTGGKCLVSYNKIHALMLLHDRNDQEFRQKMMTLLGGDYFLGRGRGWDKWATLSRGFDPFFPKFNDNTECVMHSIASNQDTYEKFIKFLEGKHVEDAKEYMLDVVFDDHEKLVDVTSMRYSYFINDAVSKLDPWLYKTIQASDYDVVQLTQCPNSSKSTSFEIMDTRWPLVGGDFAGVLNSGKQFYDMFKLWQDYIKQYVSIRDPFDLDNSSKAQTVRPAMPSKYKGLHTQSCNFMTNHPVYAPDGSLYPTPHPTDPKSSGCFPSDTITSSQALETCDAGLKLEIHNNRGEQTTKCNKIYWALNAVGNSLFSPTDMTLNSKLFASWESPRYSEIIYLAAFLEKESKKKLLDFYWKTQGKKDIPSKDMKNWKPYCDHMTVQFSPSVKQMRNYLFGQRVKLQVEKYGFQADAGQAVEVKILQVNGVDVSNNATFFGGGIKQLSSNTHTHITVSCRKGFSPVYSNTLLNITKNIQDLPENGELVLYAKLGAGINGNKQIYSL